MIIESTPLLLQKQVKSLKMKGLTIGFVPTMGALHQGHLSLIEESLKQTDKTIVSIFVNPAQFGKNEDFDKYPRNLDNDFLQLQNYNVDFVFTPTTDEIYPEGIDTTTQVTKPYLSQIYCGKTRPQFFGGVLNVVLRLFNIVQPDKAFFGEKDFQQMALIKKMAQDLFLPIEVVPCGIIREENGLAMSSRNAYLSPEQQKEASVIYQALNLAKRIFNMDETNAKRAIEIVKEQIQQESSIQIDYLVIVDPNTLLEKETIAKNDRILFAGYLGKTRLIDNMAF